MIFVATCLQHTVVLIQSHKSQVSSLTSFMVYVFVSSKYSIQLLEKNLVRAENWKYKIFFWKKNPGQFCLNQKKNTSSMTKGYFHLYTQDLVVVQLPDMQQNNTLFGQHKSCNLKVYILPPPSPVYRVDVYSEPTSNKFVFVYDRSCVGRLRQELESPTDYQLEGGLSGHCLI